MYLKRIDMHGFKSFADPVSIEFHDGITCIVGPNGSGKSNISDAVRWVLGEQSPKMLRGGKMEEVIFAGTASRKSRGMAEVTLVLDNSKNILPIDYAEVAITRRMYRSGESEYSINNNSCRLRDIKELIMDTGIGVDGYSLIGQGKISEIVSSKPESRREIFEEAAGIVKYRNKKAEAERKLESSTGNLDRVNDIIGELEGRIDGLKEDSEKASEYLILRDKYKTIEINVTLKNIESIEQKNGVIQNDLTEVSSKIDSFRDEKRQVDEELAKQRGLGDELEQKSLSLRDKLLLQIEEINRLTGRIQLNQEKLSSLESDKERLHGEIGVLEGKLEAELTHSQEALKQAENKEKELTALQDEIREKSALLERLTTDADRTAAEMDHSRNRIYELSSQISSQKTERNSLEQLADTLKRRREQVLGEKAEAGDNLSSLRERLKAADGERENLQQSLRETETAADRLKAESLKEEQQQLKLEKEIQDKRIALGQLSTQKKMIEDMENSYEGYSGAVKFIMRAKDRKGIHGVVADLIQVPEGYEKAIETALGASLQNIVCEDDASAQAAVKALKENRAGRLTFLPVKSMRPAKVKRDESLEKAAGFIGYGVSCITYDAAYQNVMEYLLGRVVIVDKLEHAVKLSKSNFSGLRFVTLEGDVVNAGGAITGGAYRNNTANLLERKTEVKKLAGMLASLQQELTDSSDDLIRIKEETQQRQQKIRDLDEAHRDQERRLLLAQSDVKNFTVTISDLVSSDEKRYRELENIEKELESSCSMIAEISEKIRLAENELAEAEQNTSDKSSDYSEKKQELEQASEELTKLRLMEGSLQSDINSSCQMANRIDVYVRDLQREKNEKSQAIEALTQRKTENLNEDAALAGDLAQKEKIRKDLEDQLKKTEDEKAAANRAAAEIQQKKEKMDETLFGYQTQKHELELRLAKNETQAESYKEKLWDEFEISYLQAIEFRKKEFVMSSAVKELREIKSRMKELGEVNIGAIKEYESVKERFEFLTEQREDLLAAMNALKQIISDMDKTIRLNFKKSFDEIVVNFEKTFQQLFGGGMAELRLEDETRPLESGIEIIAQPPGKKLQNINLMSGGEKTMTAIALMFAVLRAKPTPFCILDEVEAALDEANIERFAKYLQDFKEIQFALVTHQKVTMEYADVLYGVTMAEQGISRILSLKLGDDFQL